MLGAATWRVQTSGSKEVSIAGVRIMSKASAARESKFYYSSIIKVVCQNLQPAQLKRLPGCISARHVDDYMHTGDHWCCFRRWHRFTQLQSKALPASLWRCLLRARHSFSHVFQLQADRAGVLLVARVCINRPGAGTPVVPCHKNTHCQGTPTNNPNSPRSEKRPMRAELVAILALVFRQVLHITTGALQKNGLRTHSPGASIGSNSFGHSTQRTHPSFSNLSTGDACHPLDTLAQAAQTL